MDVLSRKKWLLICLGLCLCGQPVFAEEKIQLYEQKIKAGLVYNLLKYTSWPDSLSGQDKLKICLLGGDPFEGYLAPLEGRTARQAAIAITRIEQIQQAENCSIVIIHRNQESGLVDLLRFLDGKHVLTISDIRNFASQGGMVELSKDGEKINLYINKTAVDHAGLDIEGRMLKLAKIVSG